MLQAISADRTFTVDGINVTCEAKATKLSISLTTDLENFL